MCEEYYLNSIITSLFFGSCDKICPDKLRGLARKMANVTPIS